MKANLFWADKYNDILLKISVSCGENMASWLLTLTDTSDWVSMAGWGGGIITSPIGHENFLFWILTAVKEKSCIKPCMKVSVDNTYFECIIYCRNPEKNKLYIIGQCFLLLLTVTNYWVTNPFKQGKNLVILRKISYILHWWK